MPCPTGHYYGRCITRPKTVFSFSTNLSSLVLAKHLILSLKHDIQLILTPDVSTRARKTILSHIPDNTLEKILNVTSFADQSRNFLHHAITAGF